MDQPRRRGSNPADRSSLSVMLPAGLPQRYRSDGWFS